MEKFNFIIVVLMIICKARINYMQRFKKVFTFLCFYKDLFICRIIYNNIELHRIIYIFICFLYRSNDAFTHILKIRITQQIKKIQK